MLGYLPSVPSFQRSDDTLVTADHPEPTRSGGLNECARHRRCSGTSCSRADRVKDLGTHLRNTPLLVSVYLGDGCSFFAMLGIHTYHVTVKPPGSKYGLQIENHLAILFFLDQGAQQETNIDVTDSDMSVQEWFGKGAAHFGRVRKS